MQFNMKEENRMKYALLLVVLIAAILPAAAQESDLERMETLAINLETGGGSYTYNTVSTEDQYVLVELGENTDETYESTYIEELVTVIDAGLETENIQAFVGAGYEAGTADGTTLFYSMEAEIRYVDGVLYVNAAYLETQGDVPALPEGWVIVDDAANFPEFEVLELEDYLTDLEVVRFGLISENAARVEAETFDEGGEAITAFFDGAGFVGVSVDPEAEPNPLLDLIGELTDDVLTLTIELDENGNIIAQYSEGDVTLTDVDMTPLGYEGATLSMNIVSSSIREFDTTVTEFTPVEAPEM
jgi:hypothetical protein